MFNALRMLSGLALFLAFGPVRAVWCQDPVPEASAPPNAASVAPAVPAVPATASPELRGVWVTRFEWPDLNGNAGLIKANITRIMTTLAENNFNAVFFQVRGQCDTLYPSPFETWSRFIGGKDPGFDPLAFAIEEAHSRGIEFHAYINPFPCWDAKNPPEDPEHAYHKLKDWLCAGSDGNVAYEEYYYLSPGIPEVQAYVRKIILDVALRYNVDGIHLDRIRYPSSRVSHDPISRRRFEGEGNPGRLKWEDWQRAQVTGFVNDLYGQLQAVKPQIKLSAAVWGIYDKSKIPGYATFSSGYHDYLQDSQTWLRCGIMDALVPMIYWDIGGKKPDYDELYSHFLANAAGRHVYGGMQAKHKDPEEPVREIEYTRSVGGHGTVPFSYSGINGQNRWSHYKRIYPTQAPVPEMTWKSHPQTGGVAGIVTDPEGKPVCDAWVRISCAGDVWLTSADGVFAIHNLPPDPPFQLHVEKAGVGAMLLPEVKITPGRCNVLNIALQPAAAAVLGN